MSLFSIKNGGDMKKLLNVGGSNKTVPLPIQYADFENVVLDIDPKYKPDIVHNALHLKDLEPQQFDAVYCSHNLEHYYLHEVPQVLDGFLHLLKADGFAHIMVPDIQELMRVVVQQNLEMDDVLYQSPVGPITVLDILYGYGAEIEQSGQSFFAHKTGFSQTLLVKNLQQAGFSKIYNSVGNLQITVLAFKGEPSMETLRLFNIN